MIQKQQYYDHLLIASISHLEPPENIINSEEDFDLERWVNYTGLKIREHKPEELEAFKKPFQIGWKRELSIRAQLHSSGKRIVDISYISPCNQVRLRSYVELGVYLRNDQSCGLEPENFTFAKQPVYKYPEEVIKQLLKMVKHERRSTSHQQSNGGVSMPQLTPISDQNRSGSESNSLNNSLNNSSLNNSVAEGRTKRKRTAPTRFDDEEYFTEQTFSKKKLIIKSQPTTPSGKAQPQTTSAKATSFQPFSPKSIKKDQSGDEQADKSQEQNNFESIDKESISSVKSSKSNRSAKSEQKSQQQPHLDANSNVLNNNETDSKDNDDIDSTCSKKDENSQDQLIQAQQQQPQQQQTDAASTAASTSKPSKPKSSKRKSAKQANNANNELSAATNSFLTNSLLVENLLQNGNFECEDNDLSDCDLMIDTTMNNDQLLLPIPPCSLICAGRKGDLPTLRCSRCCCLFHPQCVRNGVFLKTTKQFVCPNCTQPDDLNNAIEDSADLFEQSNDLAEDDEPLMIDTQQIVNETINNNINKIKSSIAPKIPPKLQNFAKQAKFDNLNTHLKTNGLDGNLMKKKSNHQHLSNQIRLPTQIQRSLLNQSNQHLPSIANKTRMHPNQVNLNQMQQTKQSQFNSQLMKKLNQLATHQQDIMNLKSNMTHLANGTFTVSSLASRRTHLDSMNKSLASSQQLLESFKKLTSMYQQKSLIYQNGLTSTQQMNNKMNTTARVNHRLEQQQRQQQQQRLLNYRTQSTQSHKDTRETKFLDYLNQRQNGFKQMINQYQALDRIFDYLNVRELVKCKSVNKTFNRLANEKHHWKRLNLKGLIVSDWEYFASEIVDTNEAEELNLEGLRLPPRSSDQESNQEEILWKSFKCCFKHFHSLTKVSFGRISIQHLAYLLTNDFVETSESNALYGLEELNIKNLYDESSQSGFFSLRLLSDKISECKNLKRLRIESKQGISNDESTIAFLNNLAELLPKLSSLYLPSLRGFTIENFEFLTKLTQLECLEIGSCESWTLGTNQDDDQMQTNESEQANQENNEDSDPDAFMNENSNQENEFDGQKRLVKKHQGAFKFLSQLKSLKELYLTDVIIDEMSNQLPLVVERMCNLESLGLGYVTVSPDATQTLNILCNTLKTKLPNLRKFSISTEDPHTNKCCFDLLLKRLDNLEQLEWKVCSQVEDDGNCLVPFVRERGLESDLENEDNLDLTTGLNDCIEMVETCHLNDILQRNLSKTKVFILPQ